MHVLCFLYFQCFLPALLMSKVFFKLLVSPTEVVWGGLSLLTRVLCESSHTFARRFLGF